MENKNHYWVYIHTNLKNGKVYIGTTQQKLPELRWGKNGKGYKGNEHFWNAIQKYGWDEGFSHEYWKVDSAEEMWAQEISLIALYDSANPNKGYNRSTGGEQSHYGCHLSDEQKAAVSKYTVAAMSTPEVREHLRIVLADPEVKARQIAGQILAWADPVKHAARSGENHWAHGLKGESNPNYGSKRSATAKANMSKAQRKYYAEHPGAHAGENNPMYGKPAPNRGKSPSEESNEKRRKAMKGRPSKLKGRSPSKESNEKRSKTQTGKKYAIGLDGVPGYYSIEEIEALGLILAVSPKKGKHRAIGPDGVVRMYTQEEIDANGLQLANTSAKGKSKGHWTIGPDGKRIYYK